MLIISSSRSRINELKGILNSKFDTKDLGNGRKILGMEIEKKWSKNTLKVYQSSYLLKSVVRFGMSNGEFIAVSLDGHFILSKQHSPKTNIELIEMEEIPYAISL